MATQSKDFILRFKTEIDDANLTKLIRDFDGASTSADASTKAIDNFNKALKNVKGNAKLESNIFNDINKSIKQANTQIKAGKGDVFASDFLTELKNAIEDYNNNPKDSKLMLESVKESLDDVLQSYFPNITKGLKERLLKSDYIDPLLDNIYDAEDNGIKDIESVLLKSIENQLNELNKGIDQQSVKDVDITNNIKKLISNKLPNLSEDVIEEIADRLQESLRTSIKSLDKPQLMDTKKIDDLFNRLLLDEMSNIENKAEDLLKDTIPTTATASQTNPKSKKTTIKSTVQDLLSVMGKYGRYKNDLMSGDEEDTLKTEMGASTAKELKAYLNQEIDKYVQQLVKMKVENMLKSGKLTATEGDIALKETNIDRFADELRKILMGSDTDFEKLGTDTESIKNDMKTIDKAIENYRKYTKAIAEQIKPKQNVESAAKDILGLSDEEKTVENKKEQVQTSSEATQNTEKQVQAETELAEKTKKVAEAKEEQSRRERELADELDKIIEAEKSNENLESQNSMAESTSEATEALSKEEQQLKELQDTLDKAKESLKEFNFESKEQAESAKDLKSYLTIDAKGKQTDLDSIIAVTKAGSILNENRISQDPFGNIKEYLERFSQQAQYALGDNFDKQSLRSFADNFLKNTEYKGINIRGKNGIRSYGFLNGKLTDFKTLREQAEQYLSVINQIENLEKQINSLKEPITVDNTKEEANAQQEVNNATEKQVANLKEIQNLVEAITTALHNSNVAQLNVNSENVNLTDELGDVNKLEESVKAVTQAVNEKSSAFNDERATVHMAVSEEVDRLEELSKKLGEIITKASDMPKLQFEIDSAQLVSQIQDVLSNNKFTINFGEIGNINELVKQIGDVSGSFSKNANEELLNVFKGWISADSVMSNNGVSPRERTLSIDKNGDIYGQYANWGENWARYADDLEKADKIITNIHSHASHLIAVQSSAVKRDDTWSGDLYGTYEEYKKGNRYSAAVSRNDVQIFDIKKFWDDFKGKITDESIRKAFEPYYDDSEQSQKRLKDYTDSNLYRAIESLFEKYSKAGTGEALKKTLNSYNHDYGTIDKQTGAITPILTKNADKLYDYINNYLVKKAKDGNSISLQSDLLDAIKGYATNESKTAEEVYGLKNFYSLIKGMNNLNIATDWVSHSDLSVLKNNISGSDGVYHLLGDQISQFLNEEVFKTLGVDLSKYLKSYTFDEFAKQNPLGLPESKLKSLDLDGIQKLLTTLSSVSAKANELSKPIQKVEEKPTENIETNVDNSKVKGEIETVENLKTAVNSVKDAVQEKTDRFDTEATSVDADVDKEIKSLKRLNDSLGTIKPSDDTESAYITSIREQISKLTTDPIKLTFESNIQEIIDKVDSLIDKKINLIFDSNIKNVQDIINGLSDKSISLNVKDVNTTSNDEKSVDKSAKDTGDKIKKSLYFAENVMKEVEGKLKAIEQTYPDAQVIRRNNRFGSYTSAQASYTDEQGRKITKRFTPNLTIRDGIESNSYNENTTVATSEKILDESNRLYDKVEAAKQKVIALADKVSDAGFSENKQISKQILGLVDDVQKISDSNDLANFNSKFTATSKTIQNEMHQLKKETDEATEAEKKLAEAEEERRQKAKEKTNASVFTEQIDAERKAIQKLHDEAKETGLLSDASVRNKFTGYQKRLDNIDELGYTDDAQNRFKELKAQYGNFATDVKAKIDDAKKSEKELEQQAKSDNALSDAIDKAIGKLDEFIEKLKQAKLEYSDFTTVRGDIAGSKNMDELRDNVKEFDKLRAEYQVKLNDVLPDETTTRGSLRSGLLKEWNQAVKQYSNLGLESDQNSLATEYTDLAERMQNALNSISTAKTKTELNGLKDTINQLESEITEFSGKMDGMLTGTQVNKQITQQTQLLNKLIDLYKKLDDIANNAKGKYNDESPMLENAKQEADKVQNYIDELRSGELLSNERMEQIRNASLGTTGNNTTKLDAQAYKESAQALIDLDKTYVGAYKRMDLFSKINKDLEDNGRYAKSAKEELEGYAKELQNTEMTEKRWREIVGRTKEIQGEQTAAGNTGQTWGQKILGNIQSQNASFFAQFFSFYDIIRYGQEAFQTIQKIDNEMVELAKVSNASGDTLNKVFQDSANSAQELGASLDSLLTSTTDWNRLGYNISDSETLAKTTALFEVVGDSMTQQSAQEGLTSIMKGWGMNADQSMGILDKLNEVKLLVALLY